MWIESKRAGAGQWGVGRGRRVNTRGQSVVNIGVGKLSEMNGSGETVPGVETGILRKIERLDVAIAVVERKADIKGTGAELAGVGHSDAEIIFDSWFRKCLIGRAAVGAYIDGRPGNEAGIVSLLATAFVPIWTKIKELSIHGV